MIQGKKNPFRHLLELATQGCQSHRCRIEKGQKLIYLNEQVQAVHLAKVSMQQQPNMQKLQALDDAIKACKHNGIDTFNFKEIEMAIEAIKAATIAKHQRSTSTPPTTRNK